MPTFIRALLLTLLLCFDVAFSFHLHSRHTYLLKGTHEVAIAWSRGGSAHPEFLLTLQIEPRQSQFDKLERQLYEGWSMYLFPCISSSGCFGPLLRIFPCCLLAGPSKDIYNLVTS